MKVSSHSSPKLDNKRCIFGVINSVKTSLLATTVHHSIIVITAEKRKERLLSPVENCIIGVSQKIYVTFFGKNLLHWSTLFRKQLLNTKTSHFSFTVTTNTLEHLATKGPGTLLCNQNPLWTADTAFRRVWYQIADRIGYLQLRGFLEEH